ncbi:MAG: hypothetical protein ACAI25_01365, partial [Planctomycetota bacterium]
AGAKPAKQKTGIIRRGTATGLRPQLPSKKKPSDPNNKAVNKNVKSSGELKPVDGAAAEPGTGKFKKVRRPPPGSGTRPGLDAPKESALKGSTILVGALVLVLLVVLVVGIAMVMK